MAKQTRIRDIVHHQSAHHASCGSQKEESKEEKRRGEIDRYTRGSARV